MFCKNCGAQIADDSKFCIQCGTKLFDDAPKVNPRIFEMESPSFDEPEESFEQPQSYEEAYAEIEAEAKKPKKQPTTKHRTEHVKKEHQYGDFGADLSERFEEFKADRKLDKQARREADPQKYAKRDFRKARARKVWAIVIGVVIVAWAIGRLKVLIG